jgi:ATP-binding cassette, subfamily F, member 3
MFSLTDLGYEVGGRYLFQDVSLNISAGDRIGLVGKNGAGKSTLLRLLSGQYQPTEGSISRSTGMKLGFLSQDQLSFSSGESVFKIALQAFEELQAMQARMDKVLADFELDPTQEQLLNELGDLQTEFATNGGYEMESKVHTVLDGLGFTTEERERPFDTFSGGWRMRTLLARLLLAEPDLLLLDEPTNHLDLPSIIWMENYIQKFAGAYVLVSHDRFFLDRMVNTIWELANRKINVYDGNYTKYVSQREERRELQQNAFENQQQEIAQAERFIERFRAKASKASQAQSRIKQLDKLERIEAPESDEATINLRFNVKQKSGVDVLRLKEATKSYDGRTIFRDLTNTVQRGDRIGLIGANGTGKTTLLRVLANAEPFLGTREEGYHVKTGFYAQHQLEALRANREIWDEFESEAMERGETYVRTVLGAFLFSGDAIYKKIGVLSGGERARVALAKTLLAEANCLLLDEPTNHLDLMSIGLLTEALQQYEGTYIIVSHDRWFLRQVTNKIWYLEDQQLKEYPGSFSEFEEWKQRLAAIEQANKVAAKPAAKLAPTQPKVEAPKPTNGADESKRRQAKKDLQKVESSIETLEAEKDQLETALFAADAHKDSAKLAENNRRHQQVLRDLDAQMKRWEELAEVAGV